MGSKNENQQLALGAAVVVVLN